MIELVCGALIAVGFVTGFAAFLYLGLMGFAYFIAQAPRDFFSINNGGDAAILYSSFFLLLVCHGPGPLSS